MSPHETFRVGITRDLRRDDGEILIGDIGLDALDRSPGVEWDFLARDASELTPELVAPFDAILVWGASISQATLEGVERLSLVVRIGVGYDAVDVDTLTEQGVVLAITPEGVRRPLTSGALAFLLGLSHRLLIKDQLTRDGRWDDAYDHIGTGLTGRTLGVVGLGTIGRELLRLVQPFDMRHLAVDPFITVRTARLAGAELVELDELLTAADFVCITCPLTPETLQLINAERLALMQPSAYLINIARGPIVDQVALTQALQEGRIAGAALDVFEHEPIDRRDPILRLPNVLLAPHAVGGTDESYLLAGRSACEAVLAVARGKPPRHVVNPTVLEHPRIKSKLSSYARRNGARA